MTLAGRSMTAQPNLPNKFTGKERDTDFGLDWDYFGARYYDAVIGRFLTVDPLAEEHPDFTPYHYVLNNPLILIDPDGRQTHFANRRFLFEHTGSPFTQGEITTTRHALADASGSMSTFSGKVAVGSATAAMVTAPLFPPAALVFLKATGIATGFEIGFGTLQTTLSLPDSKDGQLSGAVGGLAADIAFEIGGKIGKALLKKIPGGQFAGTLTEPELTTLTSLVEGAGGSIEAVSEDKIAEFVASVVQRVLDKEKEQTGEKGDEGKIEGNE